MPRYIRHEGGVQLVNKQKYLCKQQTNNQRRQAGTITIGGDLTVNRMAYGAMRITGEGIWGPPKDHDECIRVLKRYP